MDKTIKIAAGLFIVIVLICAVFIALPQQAASPQPGTGRVTVYFFYGEECIHCHNVMPFMESLKQKYPDVDFQILETWHNTKNQALSASLNKKLGAGYPGVPEVIVGSVVLVGERDIPARLESVIIEELKKSGN
jgi:thiol-disulfide isomerase/thioredoxin